MITEKKEMIRTLAWAMLVFVPVLAAVIGYYLTGGVLALIPGTIQCREEIAMGTAAVLGIISYAGTAFWELKNL